MDIGLTLTAFGAMMAGFFAITKIMLNQASNDRKADRKERIKLAGAINKMGNATKTGFDKLTASNEKAAQQSEVRNGHLGEQSVKLGELVSQGNETHAKILTQLQVQMETLTADRGVNEKILGRLEESAGTLVHDEHDKAVAVKTVATDLSNSNAAASS